MFAFPINSSPAEHIFLIILTESSSEAPIRSSDTILFSAINYEQAKETIHQIKARFEAAHWQFTGLIRPFRSSFHHVEEFQTVTPQYIPRLNQDGRYTLSLISYPLHEVVQLDAFFDFNGELFPF